MNKKKLIINFSATRKFEEADYDLKTVIRNAAKLTLIRENFPYDAEISVTLCDNEYIHGLNKRYRGVDKHTDVLSFPIYENGEFDECECIGGAMLGDIVISLERAREQAEEIGNTFFEEVAFLTIHSMLHLLGYDHERGKEDEELQCRIQKEIMTELKGDL